MLIWTLLLSLVILNALFGRPIFGIDARHIAIILVLLFCASLVYHSFFYKEMYEVLIEEENIVVSAVSRTEPRSFPLYGKNDTHYFIIYPAIHYRIAIDNKCRGFNQTDKKTWCDNTGVLPHCNTPADNNRCTTIAQ